PRPRYVTEQRQGCSNQITPHLQSAPCELLEGGGNVSEGRLGPSGADAGDSVKPTAGSAEFVRVFGFPAAFNPPGLLQSEENWIERPRGEFGGAGDLSA